MTLHDLYILSPELGMVGVAMALVLADLLLRSKRMLPVLTLIGLILPLGLSLILWSDINVSDSNGMQGLFGALIVDKFALFFKILVIGTTALVVLSSVEYVEKFDRLRSEYYALILFAASGMMLLASTVELITIYISLELTTLPLAALATFLRTSRSAESGMKLLLLSAVSSAVLLYGMVLIYGFTGTTTLVGISERISMDLLSGGFTMANSALLFGTVLLIAGFGFKIGSVPFQMWVPDVYEGAPTPITAYLSVASKAAGFAVIMRVFYESLSIQGFSTDWGNLFAVLSALSMTIGNLIAVRQSNIKRMLAYSTIAHAGYLMIGLAVLIAKSPGGDMVPGSSGVLFYLAGYAVTNLAVFSAVIAISHRIDSDLIEDFAGMGHRAPFLAAVLTLGVVSLIGIPPTVGFMAKIYIFGAAMSSGMQWLAIIGVLNSVLSAYYYLRVVKTMYLQIPESKKGLAPGLSIRVAAASSFAGVIIFGIYPTPLIELARAAADSLLY